MEFWLQADGFNERCYVLSANTQTADMTPAHEASAVASRPPANEFMVYWPIVKYWNLTANEFALLLKSHVDWHKPLGVHRHVIYLTEGVLEVTANPVVQVRCTSLLCNHTLQLPQFWLQTHKIQSIFHRQVIKPSMRWNSFECSPTVQKIPQVETNQNTPKSPDIKHPKEPIHQLKFHQHWSKASKFV